MSPPSPPPNLARLAEEALQRLGDHPAVYYEGTWYRSGDLHSRARRAATGLQAMGVGPGERVVVFMANCPEVGIVYSAIWRAGAVVTPVIFLISRRCQLLRGPRYGFRQRHLDAQCRAAPRL